MAELRAHLFYGLDNGPHGYASKYTVRYDSAPDPPLPRSHSAVFALTLSPAYSSIRYCSFHFFGPLCSDFRPAPLTCCAARLRGQTTSEAHSQSMRLTMFCLPPNTSHADPSLRTYRRLAGIQNRIQNSLQTCYFMQF